MGRSRANAMLMFNKKITAQEALELGLVTEILPSENFRQEAIQRAMEYAQLPTNVSGIVTGESLAASET